MPATRLRQFLDEHGVRYVSIAHSQAYTTSEIAQSAHIPGHLIAKTVMVYLDGKLAMAVVRGTDRADLDLVRGAAGAEHAELASEQAFVEHFPDCEPGAMPPFGNLYDLPVYVDEGLARDREIAFNAGSHLELVKLAYEDFARLVQPEVARLCA